MINNKLDFGKFEVPFRISEDDFKALLAEYDFTYEDVGLQNKHLKEENRHTTIRRIKILDPILINGVLGTNCEVVIDKDAKTITSLKFTVTEFSKTNIENTIKSLNRKFHINIPIASRDDFLKDRSIYCTPFGQVELDRRKNEENDEIIVSLFFAPFFFAKGSYIINSDFGPDVLSDGIIFLNHVEVNRDVQANEVYKNLQLNAMSFLYTKALLAFGEGNINRAMPEWVASSNAIMIKECAWADEVFECRIKYDKDTLTEIESVWLYKRMSSEDDAKKLYEKLTDMVSAEDGVRERKDINFSTIHPARGFTADNCKNLLIEVGYLKETVRVGFVYDYWNKPF